MRNQVIWIWILLACQLGVVGCTGGSKAVVFPDVAFVSADEAWIASRKVGFVRLFADGSFEKVTEPPERIDILSPSDGQVFFSAWKKQTNNRQRWMDSDSFDSRLSPTSISFADDNVGWIRTLMPLFLTEDGGKTWNQILATEPGEMTKSLAADKDTAYLYGARGKILQTKDRGRTWKSRDLGNSQDILAFECRDGHPDNCWVGTGRGNVFVTSGNGPFEQVQLPGLASDISVSSIFLTGENSVLVAGYSVGDGPRFGVLFATDDNGLTWRSVDVPVGHMIRVAAFGETIWLASHSAVYRSTNKGKTWVELLLLPSVFE